MVAAHGSERRGRCEVLLQRGDVSKCLKEKSSQISFIGEAAKEKAVGQRTPPHGDTVQPHETKMMDYAEHDSSA